MNDIIVINMLIENYSRVRRCTVEVSEESVKLQIKLNQSNQSTIIRAHLMCIEDVFTK